MGSAANQVPHIPVLIDPLIASASPVRGHWLDATMGAGGYTRALLDAGAERVIGLDRDPLAIEMAAGWADERVNLVEAPFSELDAHAEALDGIVFDLGVSSMQLDQAERGFSFQKDGPLDMRMSQNGPSAADLVNSLAEREIADILFLYGEERASRRIARAITKARLIAPIETTLQLSEIIETCLPRPKPGQSHPATRSFQAIRIAVNDEFGQLLQGLEAAERALKPGGCLAVVTFHSIEDRMVKRFLQIKTGHSGRGSRHAPEMQAPRPTFSQASKKAVVPSEAESQANPRSRSAKLRLAHRTQADAFAIERRQIGMPDPNINLISKAYDA